MFIYGLATFSDVLCKENMEVESICFDHEDAMEQFSDLMETANWDNYVAEKIDEFTIKQTMTDKDKVYFWAIVRIEVDESKFIPTQYT